MITINMHNAVYVSKMKLNKIFESVSSVFVLQKGHYHTDIIIQLSQVVPFLFQFE